MKASSKLRAAARFFGFALLVPGLLAFAFGAGAADRAGAVDSLFGLAQAEIAKTERKLAQGDSVFVGDTVMTAFQSRVSMQMGEATRIRLGENARLRIDRYLMGVGGTLTLGSGPMLFDRPSGARPEALKIRGAFGVIAVRGTRFFAGPSQGKLAVFVDRGSVSVTSGGSTVTLVAGEGTDVTRPGAPPTEPKSWGHGRIVEAFSTVR